MCVSSWTHGIDNVIRRAREGERRLCEQFAHKNEAILNGYDDAIVLDVHGRVTEATVAIFLSCATVCLSRLG